MIHSSIPVFHVPGPPLPRRTPSHDGSLLNTTDNSQVASVSPSPSRSPSPHRTTILTAPNPTAQPSSSAPRSACSLTPLTSQALARADLTDVVSFDGALESVKRYVRAKIKKGKGKEVAGPGGKVGDRTRWP